jgi:hypothetical protein
MLIKVLDDRAVECFRTSSSGIAKSYNLAAIVHACDKKVVLTLWRRVPLDAPRSTTNVHFSKRYEGLSGIKEADFVIVTSHSEQMLDMRMVLY